VGDGGGGGEDRKEGGVRRDYSLKEGETITVNLGGTRFGRKARDAVSPVEGGGGGGLSGFSLPPPPAAPGIGGAPAGGALIPPPPPPPGGREKKRLSQSAEQLGFDDGKFGEFA
jgi:hypothetical protein